MSAGSISERLEMQGVLHIPGVLGSAQLEKLWARLQPETSVGAVRTSAQEVYGARGLLAARSELLPLFIELGLDTIARVALGVPAFPIDAVFLDKHAELNWAVPAHQDVVVPVPASAVLPGGRRSRRRNGVTYGEPGDEVLDELVALRVHLDEAGADSGGLCVLDASHRRGRLPDAEIRRIGLETYRQTQCSAGDVLLMKPLTVHRSLRSATPARRRVLQVLYAPRGGWHWQHDPDRGRHD